MIIGLGTYSEKSLLPSLDKIGYPSHPLLKIGSEKMSANALLRSFAWLRLSPMESSFLPSCWILYLLITLLLVRGL